MVRLLDVLLVSPRLPPDDSRRAGDHTYTDLLLEHPPEGVRYHHFEDAMAEGRVRRIRFLQLMGHNLTRRGILPPDMWAEYLVSDLQPDLVHIYGFSATVRLSRQVPILLGTSTGSYADLKYYCGWEDRRWKRAREVKRCYLRAVGAHDSSLRPELAGKVLTWSYFSQRMHLREGHVRSDQIAVLPPGLPLGSRANSERDPRSPITFLFVGRDFERKNGPLVLDAFRKVHEERLDTQLLVVSQLPDGNKIDEPGVMHRHFIPRTKLLRDVFPRADVVLLPSRAEGYGLVALEAMSCGAPVIGVDSWAMPEIIENGKTGFLIDASQDPLAALVEAMLECAKPAVLASLRQSVQTVFEKRFSVEAHNERLLHYYRAILGRQQWNETR